MERIFSVKMRNLSLRNTCQVFHSDDFHRRWDDKAFTRRR